MHISSTTQACRHTFFGHLFYNIRCPNQPLAHRVTLVVSTALLVSGLAWKGWSSYQSYCLKKRTEAEIEALNKPSLPMGGYPPEGEEAIKFAKQKLLEKAADNEKLKKELSEEHDSPYAWAVYMAQYLSEEYYKKLESLITDKDIDCWDSKEIIQHIDEYMKIVYAIGCLALEGIPNAVEANKNSFSSEIRTEMEKRAWVVSNQGIYFFRCFTMCPYIYHHARGALVMENENGQLERKAVIPSEKYVGQFYQEGTLQFQWRFLHNDYCDRARMYVNFDVLNGKDMRLVNWVKNDIDAKTFCPFPDTLPT